jgi:hypothetical protein
MKRKPTKNPAPKPLLKIGDVVTVSAVVSVVRSKEWNEEKSEFYGPLRRIMEREVIPPTRMFVVGAKRRLLGEVRIGQLYSTLDGDDYDPGYLVVDESVFVYQARVGLMRKIVEVLPQDLELCSVTQ